MITNTKILGRLATIYQRIFARPSCYPLHRLMLKVACKGLGMLSSNPQVNGEYWFLANHGKSFKTVFDIGANTGEYTDAILQLCPLATVFCFEAHPRSIAVLCKRFAAEPRVRVIDKAVGKIAGRSTLYDHERKEGSQHASLVHGVIEKVHKTSASAVMVDVTSLDEFISAERLTAVDFIKIDVEGGERDVLEGAVLAVGQLRPRFIQLEFNEMNLLTSFSLVKLAEQLSDYCLYRLLPRAMVQITDVWALENKIFAYQNIVAVRRSEGCEPAVKRSG